MMTPFQWMPFRRLRSQKATAALCLFLSFAVCFGCAVPAAEPPVAEMETAVSEAEAPSAAPSTDPGEGGEQAQEAPEPVHFTDMMGRQVELEAPASRIVVLAPGDCEILYAIGAGETVVGRGEYCDYPKAALSVPVVQTGSETNIEQILALEPQVVSLNTMAQTLEQVDALESAGVKTVASRAADIAGAYQAIEMLGALTGRQAEAAALVASMQAGFASLSAQAAEAGLSGKTVYFEVSPLEYGLWTAGSGTFMDEIGSILGLTNIFADVEGWAEISQEQVLARDPDYIVTIAMDLGGSLSPQEEILQRAGWEAVAAIRSGAVYSADSNAMARPGPRLLEAAQELFAAVCAETVPLAPAA